MITIDRGTEDDPWPCARLRRDTVDLSILEIVALVAAGRRRISGA